MSVPVCILFTLSFCEQLLYVYNVKYSFLDTKCTSQIEQTKICAFIESVLEKTESKK